MAEHRHILSGKEGVPGQARRSERGSKRSLVVVRGGGDLGSGVVHRLRMASYPVIVLEAEQPTVIRRTVAFASAVFDGEIVIEGVTGRRVADMGTALALLPGGIVPVLVDPVATGLGLLQPAAIVDARLAKRLLDTTIDMAPVVIGLGPGFDAGRDVHAVIETQRGHSLGSVIWAGRAAPDSGVPGTVGGEGARRVVRAPAQGVFRGARQIGERVQVGDVIGYVGEAPVAAALDGVLRGLLHDGLRVPAGFKVADVDPRAEVSYCFTISDKSRAIGGAVLEALLHLGVKP